MQPVDALISRGLSARSNRFEVCMHASLKCRASLRPPIRIPVTWGVRLCDHRLYGTAPSPHEGGLSGTSPRRAQAVLEEHGARANSLPGEATGQ